MTKNNDVLFINPCIKKSSPGFPVWDFQHMDWQKEGQSVQLDGSHSWKMDPL